MKKTGRILLILNLPPPYGGGEIISEYLYNHVSGDEKYYVISNSRNKSNKSTQGKFTFGNVYFGIKLFLKTLYYIVFFRPGKIYLIIPKQFKPFLRTALIIGAASYFNITIYGELAGENFVFLRQNNYQKKIGLFFLKQVSQIRVLGFTVKNKLAEFDICKLVVIDNGVYVPENFINIRNSKENTLQLLFVGALNYSKGIKTLIEAISLLQTERIEIHLHVMGEWSDNNQKTEILYYIKDNNLSEMVTFHGLVTSKEKWEIYKKCSILVHPTYWDGQPLVLLEAMGCGLALISTKIGAIPDTMKDNYNGLLLPENNPDELGTAIKTFYYDRELINKMAENNLKTFKEKFTIDSYILRMRNWLES